MFNSAAARFMLPILVTASRILKSFASMCALPPRASLISFQSPVLFANLSIFDALGLDSVVGGITILSPVVFWLFRGIGDPRNCLHIFQTKFYRHQQTEWGSMFDSEKLSVVVCDK